MKQKKDITKMMTMPHILLAQSPAADLMEVARLFMVHFSACQCVLRCPLLTVGLRLIVCFQLFCLSVKEGLFACPRNAWELGVGGAIGDRSTR